MGKYDEYTAIELLKMVNDIDRKHSECKHEILKLLTQVEEIDGVINTNAKKMEELELEYVEIMEKIIEKQNEQPVG